MSKVIVISTSLRAKSNSDILTEQLIAGAKDAGHEVAHISLKGKKIGFCIGCLACQKTQQCVLKDDAIEIAEKVKNADTLVFATPMDLVSKEPLSIRMSMYGGFEQVGSIGTSLPRNDVQTTTEAGDIVLYSGDQIVIFYGSNSWSYTRIGRITDKNVDELAEMLGKEDVTISIDSE